eukprot:756805-Hanusia_phi.AAC.2
MVEEGSKEQRKVSVSLVRVGPKSQMRRDVWEEVSLDTLVARRMAQLRKDSKEEGEKGRKREGDLKHLKEEVERITEQLDKDGSALSSEAMKGLQERRHDLLTALSVRSGTEGKINSELNAVTAKLRVHILNSVQAIIYDLPSLLLPCPISSLLNPILPHSSHRSAALSKLTRGFDLVIIDEAAQAIEPSTLIPLQVRRLLTPDPSPFSVPLSLALNLNSVSSKEVYPRRRSAAAPWQTVAATVFSRRSEELKFTRSLFERLQIPFLLLISVAQLAGYESHMLTVQYRMHPKIRAFPSRHFYQDRLTDFYSADEMAAPWHEDDRLAPLVWLDVRTAEKFGEGAQRNSRFNRGEAKACAGIVKLLQRKVPRAASLTVAVMSPYRRQVVEIRRQLQEHAMVHLDVQVSSVDAFQGREVDVALLSCVRSGSERSLGFVSDVRRMNVALTRARRSLVVLGNSSVLSQVTRWGMHTRRGGDGMD